LQYTKIYYNIQQYIAIYHNILQYLTIYNNILPYTTIYYNIKQYIAIYNNNNNSNSNSNGTKSPADFPNLPSNIPRHRQVVEQRAPLVGDPARAPAADLEISGLSG
jgi:hypothetical protein